MSELFEIESKIREMFEATPEEERLYSSFASGYIPKQRYVCVFEQNDYSNLKKLYTELKTIHEKQGTSIKTQSSLTPVFPEEFGDITHFKLTSDDAFKVTTFKHEDQITVLTIEQSNNEEHADFLIRSTEAKINLEKLLNQRLALEEDKNKTGKLKHNLNIKCKNLLLAIGETSLDKTIRRREPSGEQLTLTCHYEDGKPKRFPVFKVALKAHYKIYDQTAVPRKKRNDAGKGRKPIIVNGQEIMPTFWIVKR